MVPGASRGACAGSSLKDSQSGQKDDSSRPQGSGGSSFNIVAALFALLVAVIVGFVLLSLPVGAPEAVLLSVLDGVPKMTCLVLKDIIFL
uniref:Uncharacterized protein n=1 Tax=Arundo donax TaxID=35708 RepID=A0A0A9DBG4_ARUDO